MKKLTLLLAAFTFIILSSCSSDDESSDSFIGLWKYYKIYEDGVEVSLDNCENQDTFHVMDNGNFTTTIHEEDNNGECQVDEIVSGTWENLGNGIYSTTFGGITSTREVFFESNTMYFETIDLGITYREVFVRQ